MIFDAPQWFMLIPAFAALAWLWKRLRLWWPLRILSLLLLVLALADPRIRRTEAGLDLWMIVDRSRSAEDIASRDFEEWKKLLESSKPSRDDRLRIIEYAGDVRNFADSETGTFTGDRSLTRTHLALQNVLSQVEKDRHARILLFTDGYSTEPVLGALSKLEETGVPLDYRLLGSGSGADYLVSELQLPSRVQRAEPFMMEIEVRGTIDGEVPLAIYRDGQQLLETTVLVEGGRGRARFSDRIPAPGAFQYEARISPENDAHLGNNRHESYIEIVSGPRVLLITGYVDDPMEVILRNQGFEVETVIEAPTLKPGQLSGVRAVIINNVPAYEVPQDFLAALPFFVKEQGGGFLMAGGKKSFGAGAYFESAIDELLPVSMELKAEHRKLAVAMSIVMDRSGSMGAGVTGGKTKMDLANEGSARAVELLGESDVISVYAVDSTPHEMVRPTKVGPNRASIINRVRRIQSSGGGIFVYNGLEAGWNALQVSQVGQRHLILFSDAADSEQPHQYKKLLKDMAAGGATVSVIGLGTDKDPDAPFLKDVAARGGGRIFFTTDASTLPNLFAMETVSVARSTFIAEPVATKATGAWFELSERELDWLPTVDGYNLSYLREGCSAPLLTTDEYKAPLVATGQRGIGRAAAISFAMGGEYSEGIRAWDGFGDFVQTLNRWLMGEELPEGIGIRPSLDGTTMKIDLVYDEELWAEKFAINPPRIILAEGRESPEMRNLVWERIRPGQFSASADLEPGKMVRGAIQVGSTALPFGPIVVGSDAEWTFEPRRRAEIRELAVETGGRELLDLKEAWVKPPRESYASFQPWLFTAFLLFTLLDALATRLGWVWPNLAFLKRRPVPAGELVPASKGASAPAKKEMTAERFRKAKKPSKGYQTVGRTEAAPAEAEATPPPAKKAASKKKATPPKEDDGASRRDRFKRAKKGR